MVFQYTRDTRYLSARGKLVMWAYANKLEVRTNDLEFFPGEIGQLAGSRRRKNFCPPPPRTPPCEGLLGAGPQIHAQVAQVAQDMAGQADEVPVGGGGVAGGEDTPTVSRVSWIEGSETGYGGSHIPSGCVGPALNIPSALNTVSTSLISGVPDSIKNKIWEGRYVDLALLVFKQDATLAFDVGQGEGAAQLVVHQRAAGKIRTIAEWDRAFARLHAILIRVQPHLSEALTAHVGKIAGIGGDCLNYDETYRLGVSEGVIKWGQMNVDLSLDAVLFSRGGQWRGFRGEPQRGGGPEGGFAQGPPTGYCFAYHSRGFCSLSSSSWKHTCPKCGARHPAKACLTSFPRRRAQVEPSGGDKVAGKQFQRDAGPRAR